MYFTIAFTPTNLFMETRQNKACRSIGVKKYLDEYVYSIMTLISNQQLIISKKHEHELII